MLTLNYLRLIRGLSTAIGISDNKFTSIFESCHLGIAYKCAGKGFAYDSHKSLFITRTGQEILLKELGVGYFLIVSVRLFIKCSEGKWKQEGGSVSCK